MKIKLAEALLKQKKLKNRVDDLLFRIEKIETLMLPKISVEKRSEEENKVNLLLNEYQQALLELMAVRKAIQQAGFLSGIKELLVELEGLKGLLAKLRSLTSKGPMGEQFWESMPSSWNSDSGELVQHFWPVNQERLSAEIVRLSARIESLDIEIQKRNWLVEVEI